MKTNGDWVLPRFNEELRLKKPPLNYWVTIAVSQIDGVNADIQIYHGRLVSLLAALLMVLLTARTGEMLYGKAAGTLAAMLLLCTAGFLNYSHNAKPDFLYATLCALQLFAWIEAWRADTPSAQKWNAWLGWAAAGLATLAKGPQVPAVFLLGLLVFLVAGPDRRRLLKIVRPFSGVFLFCVIVLPWWFLLQRRLEALGVNIADSQLSGSLLRDGVSWKELLSFFYLWTPALEMFPASLLLLLIIPPLIKNRVAMQPATRLMACVSVTMLLLFTLGGQYRKHYVLPLLPVFSLFIANNIGAIRFQGLNRPWLKTLCAAGLVCAAASSGFMVWNGAYDVLALFSGAGLLIFLLLKKELLTTFSQSPLFTKQLLAVTAALTLLGAGYRAYGPATKWRAAEQELKKYAGNQLAKEDRLICWKTSVNVLPYFAKQPVRTFSDPDKLSDYLASNQNGHRIFAIVPVREGPAFSEQFNARVLQTAVNSEHPAKSLSLVEILGAREYSPQKNPQ